ncbi:MAG: SGNH/GDSL hydrolase family protein [Oscillatoriales cyanobacterium]|nr:MAG: SGNH/GDSL hydrolase family protein [Oscillatoriales cyanobacterium]TAH20862.1 MAG: SGNH/GDSL hydrolase family protein [Oscillatoriales cyanobacterium]
MKLTLIILAVTAGLWLALEVLLRVLFGFGNPLIYIPDAECGYLLAPNQRVRRLGNRIEINEYSMRTGAIAPLPPIETLRVLLLGDSVANGGWWTDQTDTISEIMARQLRLQIPNLATNAQLHSKVNYSNVEVLNCSANSWGPRNQLAYIKRFGLFGAKVVVLLLNTDDLFTSAPCPAVVGRDRAYPDRKPLMAIGQLLNRYLLPTVPREKLATPSAQNEDKVGSNLEAIRQIKTVANLANIDFVLAITPKLHELDEIGSHEWEVKARSRLTELVATDKITYIDFLSIFNSAAEPLTFYRDSIHLSPKGNQLVSQIISYQI